MLTWKGFILITAVLFPISACLGLSAAGALFDESQTVEHKTNAAVVYIYRNSFVGSALDFDIRINRRTELPLQNKGYHVLVLPPGLYEFLLLSNERFMGIETIDLASGNIYYLKYWGARVGSSLPIIPDKFEHGLKNVLKSEALPELKECRLIETPLVVDGVVQSLRPYGWSELK